jgi:hypothetical protein
MKKKLSVMFIVFGIAFVLYAIFGRYWVLPGYFETLESGATGATTTTAAVDGWKIARYILWAYAFKLGIYFVMIGAVIGTAVKKRMIAVYVIGGLAYIAFAYIPIPAPKLLFGIGGAIMSAAIILLIICLTGMRGKDGLSDKGLNLRIFGYFFFAMATYNLCPLMGIKCFALSPEKMIRYGLQTDAESFAAHILIELALGWCFVLAGYLLSRRKKSEY